MRLPVSGPGTDGAEETEGTAPHSVAIIQSSKQERPMDLELARGIFLGLLALIGLGGIIDMYRE
jgi:hypothetical protein